VRSATPPSRGTPPRRRSELRAAVHAARAPFRTAATRQRVARPPGRHHSAPLTRVQAGSRAGTGSDPPDLVVLRRSGQREADPPAGAEGAATACRGVHYRPLVTAPRLPSPTQHQGTASTPMTNASLQHHARTSQHSHAAIASGAATPPAAWCKRGGDGSGRLDIGSGHTRA
jgi:hypothetical protein